jgi:hypothetical protein
MWAIALLMVAVSAMCLSAPSVMWDTVAISDEEYADRLKQANLGVAGAAAALVALFLLAKFTMSKKKLYSGTTANVSNLIFTDVLKMS